VNPASLFLGKELNHPLGLQWLLYELEVQKDSKGLNEFWEAALTNMRKAHTRLANRNNAVMWQKLHQRFAKLGYK
jgi:hypothetical protein